MARIVVVAVTLCFASLASAQGVADADLKRAREAYAAGQALYNQAKYAPAAAKFEEANRLSPRAGNLFNIGRCYEQLKDVPRSLKAFREYLRLAPDAKERSEVETSIGQLEGQLRARGVQQVALRAEPEGKVRVRLDDKDLGLAPVAVELGSGKHAVELSAEGYNTTRAEFVLGLEHAIDLSYSLTRLGDVPLAGPVATPDWTPPPAPPPVDATTPGVVGAGPPPPRKPYVWAWVTSGLTVAAVAAGIVLGVLQMGAQNQLKDQTILVPRTRDANQALATQVTNLAIGADVGYGVGGLAGLASVFLFIFEGR